jgi:PAS domain S-box-containing protein
MNAPVDIAALMTSVVEASPEAVVVVDAENRVSVWNAAAERLFGYTSTETIGQDSPDLVPQESREVHDRVLLRLNQGQTVAPYRTTRIRRDGTRFDASVNTSPLRDSSGSVIGIATFTRDISSKVSSEENLRKLAREQVEASEARFRALAETVPQLVWSCRTDGSCDYLSPQWVRYTGIPKADHLGFGWTAQVHPDDRDTVTKAWETASSTGTPFDVDIRIRRHDGVYHWFKTRALPQRDEDGNIIRWFGSNTNIQDILDAQETLRALNRELEERVHAGVTEALRATRKLEELTKQLTEAQRLANLGSWELNNLTGELTWSDELFRSFGLDPTTVTTPLTLEEQSKLFEPESWQRLTEAIENGLKTGESYAVELQFVLEDGSPRWMVGRGEAIRDASGEIVGLRGTTQDITDQKLVQLELERKSERMELATSAARIGVWDFDVTSGLLVWDQIMHEIYGTDPATFTGGFEDWRSALHPEDLAPALETFNQSLSGHESFDTVFRVVVPDGSVRHVKRTAVIHFHADGSAERAVGVNWDITKQVEAELSLRASESLLQTQKEELERSNHDLQQFAYAASHDLQEPLRAVAGCAQILQRRYAGELDESADELIQHVVDGANRMQALIQDLLAYSRVGQPGGRDVLIDSGDALNEAIALLDSAVQESQAEVTFDSLPMLKGNIVQLTQLFQNLLGNALKYKGSAPPKIHVTVRKAGPEWEFSVKDNGIGIEAQYFSRIFRLFQRLHTRTEHPGTGIGLALCQRIVNSHGGRIWVDSSLGNGSTFYFTLPVAEEPATDDI